MIFEIHPKQGLGSARFGMSPEQVDKIFGEPRSRITRDERLNHSYPSWIKAGFENNKLCLVGAAHYADGITYRGIDIFKADPFEILRMLEHDCGKAFYSYGFVVFPSFGISLTGFHDGDEDARAMAIDLPEVWETDETLKPISFLKKP